MDISKNERKMSTKRQHYCNLSESIKIGINWYYYEEIIGSTKAFL